jgi:hypothetical protein
MLITSIVQEVLYEVPHAPEPIVEKAILRSVQDFCQRTRRWVVDGTDISIVSGTSDYTLAASAQTDENAVALLFRIIGIDKIEDEDDRAITEYTYNDGVLTLNREPTTTATYTVELQLKPLETATAIYDPLWEDYTDGILAGAKYRLLRMRGVAWENQAGAKENQKLFDQQVHRCRTNKWNEDGTKELTRTLTGW